MRHGDPYPRPHKGPTKRLADGTRRTYWYSWKAGPRIHADPGSPEFVAEHLRNLAERRAPKARGTVQALLDAYQRGRGRGGSGRGFLDLADRTRRDYAEIIRKHLEPEFGDMPLAALSDPRVRSEFLDWRDRRAETSARRADYEFTVLARVFAWAFDRRLILANPLERPGRVWRGSRRESVWTKEDEAAFLQTAPAHLRLALILALWTGQRQGDLLRLPWSAYDGDRLQLTQGKTGARVAIPCGAPLRAALDATPRRSPIILTNEAGRPWSPDGFRSSWRKAAARAGVTGLTFNDLRGTAVTRLRRVGCSHAEIGAITGHKNAEVAAILEAHYAATDPALAESAVRKLETGTKSPNRAPNRRGGSEDTKGKA